MSWTKGWNLAWGWGKQRWELATACDSGTHQAWGQRGPCSTRVRVDQITRQEDQEIESKVQDSESEDHRGGSKGCRGEPVSLSEGRCCKGSMYERMINGWLLPPERLWDTETACTGQCSLMMKNYLRLCAAWCSDNRTCLWWSHSQITKEVVRAEQMVQHSLFIKKYQGSSGLFDINSWTCLWYSHG